MRLLICTQALDRDDPVLGFFHRWIEEFSKNCESIEVICLREGAHSLPSNVHIHSLGKERGTSRITRAVLFYRYIVLLRNTYDSVFVHMNPEYVILGWKFWWLWRKRIGLWYNHASGTPLLRIALVFADVIFHTSPFSASAGTRKSHLMPAGIDTELFRSLALQREPLSIYYQGRIAPAKRVALLCDAVRALRREGSAVRATIVGPEESAYGSEIRREYAELIRDGSISIPGPASNSETPTLYAKNEVSVNLASSGGLDKTVLESYACETPAIVSSEAFGELVPQAMRFREGDLDSLILALKGFFALPQEEKSLLGEHGRAIVIEKHALTKLIPLILRYMHS